jgi:predicted nucleotide-binding protein (sugar kinase/HSP70/actin superfamily)
MVNNCDVDKEEIKNEIKDLFEEQDSMKVVLRDNRRGLILKNKNKEDISNSVIVGFPYDFNIETEEHYYDYEEIKLENIVYVTPQPSGQNYYGTIR